VKLSIVIVNYRAWGHIEKALRVIEPDFPDDWEMIIVDNETDPQACAGFQQRFGWVKIIPNPANSGFGQGCIIGVAAASGEQFLFMNPDVLASVADIRALMREKVRYPDVAIIAPKQLDDDGRAQKVFDEFPDVLNQSKTLKLLRRKLFPGRAADPRRDHDELVYCDWVTGSFLLIDRADYDLTGGWSNDYWMYVEDADLCKRAHDAGLRVAYTPKVAVVHSHGGSSRINVAVKALTKLEVIISKHVYVRNHFAPDRRLAGHLMIALLRLPALLLASLLDVLTLGRVATLSIRHRMLAGLLSYYAGVRRTGLWFSPRALENKAA
jgi:GT2 family glycosyltransferase